MTTRHPIELILMGIATLLVALSVASGARSEGAAASSSEVRAFVAS
jgi:hypothetical protein